MSSFSSLSFIFLSPLSLSFISSISSISFLPFSGRWHKITQKGWHVIKPQHNNNNTFGLKKASYQELCRHGLANSIDKIAHFLKEQLDQDLYKFYNLGTWCQKYSIWSVSILRSSGLEVIKLFSCSTEVSMKMLSWGEHEIFSATKYENANNSWHFHIY